MISDLKKVSLAFNLVETEMSLSDIDNKSL